MPTISKRSATPAMSSRLLLLVAIGPLPLALFPQMYALRLCHSRPSATPFAAESRVLG
ncbi:hypothetical protein NGR_b07570 (plasmid) [Sinorhizobium fredii NGR234]|uniref:Uncharacterized protein n=1 Tax=Sinorhizobium fredii (strain NBRC 101917 / NGR234) TaxID=394 RepID=C3KQ57_SINFN|nr:hypothetical protein NGR_b07570 [Sinorhizobium fredii NGR234]